MNGILSLDPGVTTGWATALIEDEVKVMIRCGQGKWIESELYEFMINLEPEFIVYETFEYRPGKARMGLNLAPTELIGIIKLYGQVNIIPTYAQKAATGKAFFNDDKIKELGLYDKKYRHGRDALRHLLHWLQFGAGFALVNEPTFELI